MGVIKDIVNIVAPRVQKTIEKEGISIREALYKELDRLGYMTKGKVDSEKMNNIDGGKS